jgi:hypothetical protein
MEPQNLVPVYLAPDPFKADLIKNMLEEEGIRVVLQSDDVLVGSIMGENKVLVEDSQADEARKLIEEHEDQVIADSLQDLAKGDTETEDESDGDGDSAPPSP